MPPADLIQFFRKCRAALRTRWEQHLRSLPPSTAMATPDALVHLMDWTLQRVEAELCAPNGHRNPHRDPVCPCGLNPLTTYFITAENAAVETLFADTSGWVLMAPPEREEVLRRTRVAIQRVALREVEAFCAMCKQRESHAHPHHGAAALEATPAESKSSAPADPVGSSTKAQRAETAPRRSGWLP
jgi:hypothetical protein